MTLSSGEPDLEAVYHTFKKKYQELKSLRSDSVVDDSADLRKKLDEHRRVHGIAVGELRAQNEELKKLIQEAESNRNDVERLHDSVRKLRSQLQQRDPVLSVFLKHSVFSVRVIGHRRFEIRVGDALVFTIEPSSSGRSDELQFHFSKYPPAFGHSSGTDFVREDATFSSSHLEGFCNRLRRGLEAADLWVRQ